MNFVGNSTHLDHLVHQVLPSPVGDDLQPFTPTPLSEIPGSSLGVGSMVEVVTDISENLYGVIRWIGSTQGSSNNRIIVGVELEDEQADRPLMLTDGTYNGLRLFRCPPGRAIFVHPSQCTKDRRFSDIDVGNSITSKSNRSSQVVDNTKMFGQVECPVVEGSVPPLSEYFFFLVSLFLIFEFEGKKGPKNLVCPCSVSKLIADRSQNDSLIKPN